VHDADRDELRLGSVLSDVQFPARSWQLIAHAEHRGADWKSRAELRSLPPGNYRDLDSVLAMIRRLREAGTASAAPLRMA
jgi:hypothetical protein